MTGPGKRKGWSFNISILLHWYKEKHFVIKISEFKKKKRLRFSHLFSALNALLII